MASCLEDLIAEQITPAQTLMVLPQKTDIYPGCITTNEFSSSMRWSTTQQNRAWRQFQWVWLHFQRSRSVQVCAKHSQIRKRYIESLPSVLKDKNYLEKFPLRCLLGRKLTFWSAAPNSCCPALSCCSGFCLALFSQRQQPNTNLFRWSK